MRFSVRYRIVAYVLAWAGALFATDPSFKLWPVVYMFPLGIYAFFVPAHREHSGWFVLGGVTAAYLVQAIVYFRTRTTLTAVIMFLLLVAALTCNVAGCRAMNQTH